MHINCLLLLFMMFALSFVAAPGRAQQLPPDSAYVQVVDGHLAVDGERQRYWAAIGQVFVRSDVKASDTPEQAKQKVERARRGTDVLIQRLKDLGFNSVRLWEGFAQPVEYEAGDGSKADAVDYFIKRAGKEGLRVWTAGMNGVTAARPEDASILPDAPDAEAWAQAVREMCKVKDGEVTEGWKLRNNLARMWDDRLETLAIREMQNIATHQNRHTGLRWCDDPTFAVWELSNEEWWMRKMVGGQWQKYPDYFRNKLISRWNAFLLEKYGSNAALTEAWGGLLEGESLADGTVLLTPMAGQTKVSTSINDAGAQAQAAVQSLEQEYSRDDFSVQRAADVLEFFMGLQLTHKQREAAAIKPPGKSTRLSPMIYDTGIGYEAQSQYLHQHADAVAHDAYINGTGDSLDELLEKVDEQPNEHQRKRMTQEAERRSRNSGQWNNWLLKPPGIAQGVPWLEHNRVEGMPFLVYETQIQQPAKYRADFPLRLAALAAIQDWDWVCWHYFGDGGMLDRVGVEDKPFEHKLDVTVGGHPQGYHFTYDEVQSAMMRAAGYMFTQAKLDPAPDPTVFIYGRESLYNPDSMDYGGSYGDTGLDMLQTVYQHGNRIRIDPTREDDEVIGPVVAFEDRHTHNPYTPTDQIVFDWKKGFVSFDGPAAVAWTGLLGNVGEPLSFEHGVTLSNVSVHNPASIYEPVGDEKYISFALYSRDGKPLHASDEMTISLVSTSYNTGFGRSKDPGGSNAGELPVLVARVAGTVTSDHLTGMSYTMYDWNMQPIGEGRVTDGKLVIPSDKPIFLIELKRS